jgi:hypothetical protein
MTLSLWWTYKAKPWLKKNWMWLLLPVGILLFIFGRTSKPTRKIDVVSTKLHGADVKREELKAELEDKVKELDDEKADKIAKVVIEHKGVIDSMTDEQKEKADELLEDPDELNSYLLNVGQHVRGG